MPYTFYNSPRRAARTKDDVDEMMVLQMRCWRHFYILSGALLLLYGSIHGLDALRHGVTDYLAISRWRDSTSSGALKNLGLTEEQCNAAFPGLTKDIDDMVSLGPFTLETPTEMGPLVARVKDGSVSLMLMGCVSSS